MKKTSTTISLVIPISMYNQLKFAAQEKGRGMSWVVRELIRGHLSDKTITEADLILQELEQQAAKVEAQKEINILIDDLKEYPHDKYENLSNEFTSDGASNPEWRHAHMRNLENKKVRDQINKEIDSLRRKNRLPGRPRVT